ncbi:unnamed protein product [Spirodela intermedia]|uniref:Uncharacterized protein n=1 Tax=Spirodela intermedia TaxID=51605 RepID=A0A7I8JJX8_SPIIN|nr:unnamed protein product [Spirodela intermedia]CAA6670439.1 unnamed protein product [Spirodela intermedia]
MLTVAFRTMVKLVSAAGTLGSDLQLENPCWPIMPYLILHASAMMERILSEFVPLAAVHNLRVLAQAFQAWCAIIALQHLQGAAPRGWSC